MVKVGSIQSSWVGSIQSVPKLSNKLVYLSELVVLEFTTLVHIFIAIRHSLTFSSTEFMLPSTNCCRLFYRRKQTCTTKDHFRPGGHNRFCTKAMLFRRKENTSTQPCPTHAHTENLVTIVVIRQEANMLRVKRSPLKRGND